MPHQTKKMRPTVSDIMHDGVYITALKEALCIIDASEGDMDFAKFKIRERLNEGESKVELPPLDKESEVLESSNGYYTYASVQKFRELAEERLLAALTESQSLRSQLEAMTADRDLWQGDHNQDCPNAVIVETLEQKLATAGEVIGELVEALRNARTCMGEAGSEEHLKQLTDTELGKLWVTVTRQADAALIQAEEFRKGIATKEDSRHAD